MRVASLIFFGIAHKDATRQPLFKTIIKWLSGYAILDGSKRVNEAVLTQTKSEGQLFDQERIKGEG